MESLQTGLMALSQEKNETVLPVRSSTKSEPGLFEKILLSIGRDIVSENNDLTKLIATIEQNDEKPMPDFENETISRLFEKRSSITSSLLRTLGEAAKNETETIESADIPSTIKPVISSLVTDETPTAPAWEKLLQNIFESRQNDPKNSVDLTAKIDEAVKKLDRLIRQEAQALEAKGVKNLDTLKSLAQKYGLNLRAIETQTVDEPAPLSPSGTTNAKASPYRYSAVTAAILEKKSVLQTAEKSAHTPEPSQRRVQNRPHKTTVHTRTLSQQTRHPNGSDTRISIKTTQHLSALLNRLPSEPQNDSADIEAEAPSAHTPKKASLKTLLDLAPSESAALDELPKAPTSDKTKPESIAGRMTKSIEEDLVINRKESLPRPTTEHMGDLAPEPLPGHTATIDEKSATQLHQKSVEAKQTIRHFAQSLREQVENYKPPFTRMQLSLDPKDLGSVEVTLVSRGNNLHIQVTSNPTAIGMMATQGQELKAQLVNMGFTDVQMQFGMNQQRQQQNRQDRTQSAYASETTESGDLYESLEILIPHYA